MKLNLQDARFQLNIHDTLIAFTDGFVEARSPARDREFGIEQLKKVFASLDARVSLESAATKAREAVDRFTQSTELQDDLTLFLLRRVR